MVAPGVKLEAINEEELTKLVFEYRLRNGIPIGDIERDLDNYYCSKWPEACHKEAADWAPENAAAPTFSSEPLLNRVSRWAAWLSSKLPRGGYQLVGADEAKRRGSLCAGCPRNQSWRTGCRGCSSSTAALLAQMRKTQSSQHHASLMGCASCGWDNQTSVWMPVECLEITDTQKDVLPERCWRKTL